MKKFYVYSLKASDENEIFYIGKTFEGSKRLNEHKSHSKVKRNRTANKIRSILKRGAELIMTKIEEFDDEDLCFKKEIELIKKYGQKNNGGILTNHTTGGEGAPGYKRSIQTRKKMSLVKIGNKINVGRKRPDVVEKWAKEVSSYDMEGNHLKTFISERDAARFYELDYRQVNECTNGKIKCTGLPKKSGHIRFKRGNSKENIGKIIQNQRTKGAVIQYDKDNNEINHYYNAREASEKTGINATSIRQCCNKKQKFAGGFLWKRQEGI